MPLFNRITIIIQMLKIYGREIERDVHATGLLLAYFVGQIFLKYFINRLNLDDSYLLLRIRLCKDLSNGQSGGQADKANLRVSL